jgi:hypothetical protein
MWRAARSESSLSHMESPSSRHSESSRLEIGIIFLAEWKPQLAWRYILRVFHYKFAFRMHGL